MFFLWTFWESIIFWKTNYLGNNVKVRPTCFRNATCIMLTNILKRVFICTFLTCRRGSQTVLHQLRERIPVGGQWRLRVQRWSAAGERQQRVSHTRQSMWKLPW